VRVLLRAGRGDKALTAAAIDFFARRPTVARARAYDRGEDGAGTMSEQEDDVTRQSLKAPPARADDPQKPGQPLTPGPQGEAGTTGPAGGVTPPKGDAHTGESGPRGPDDRGTGEGDRGGL
jgi:hypothetical protein